MNGDHTRRRVVGVLACLVVPLAGCSGGDGATTASETDTTESAIPTTETATETATDTPTPTSATTTSRATETATDTVTESPTPAGDAAAVDDYLSDANNYDGTITDATGVSEVSVAVGAGDGFAFGPAAVRVDSDTTIVWEWTGSGGLHNVVEEDDAFDSGDPESGRDITFEHTFSETGVYLYYCDPHRSLGMKGAVVVE
jgi:halocyanin-like protein